MTKRFNKRVHPELVAARRKLRAAKSAYRRTLRKVQEECSHEVVWAAPWTNSEWFSAPLARRICCRCGREEENRYDSSWTGTCTSSHINTVPNSKLLLGTDLVIRVTQSEINYKRLDMP